MSKSKIRVMRGSSNEIESNKEVELPLGTPLLNTDTKELLVSTGPLKNSGIRAKEFAYNKHITTQEEFDTLINNVTWNGVTSILLDGTFKVTSPVIIPSTVLLLQGINGATLTNDEFLTGTITTILVGNETTVIKDLNIEITYNMGEINHNVITTCYSQCHNLINCNAKVSNLFASGTITDYFDFTTTFNNCTNLTNCKSFINRNYSSTEVSYNYNGCKNLIGCSAGYTSAMNNIKEYSDNINTCVNCYKTNGSLFSNIDTLGSSKNVTTNINGKAITTIFENDGITVKDATNVKTSINDKLITDIFEVNGTTVKKATWADISDTQIKGTSSTKIATTQFVMNEMEDLMKKFELIASPNASSYNLSQIANYSDYKYFNITFEGYSGWTTRYYTNVITFIPKNSLIVTDGTTHAGVIIGNYYVSDVGGFNTTKTCYVQILNNTLRVVALNDDSGTTSANMRFNTTSQVKIKEIWGQK